MNWKQLISNKRFGLEEIHATRKDDRSEFQRDFDRLIFSAPFRRLQNKTQVFPLPGSIFVHNRLTHSLEVSCVGRSLGDSIANRLLAKHPELPLMLGIDRALVKNDEQFDSLFVNCPEVKDRCWLFRDFPGVATVTNLLKHLFPEND